MILMGKCLTDFEAWYKENYNDARPPFLNHFYNYPFPFQQGVYLQFFREKGIGIDILCVEGDLYDMVVFKFSTALSGKRFQVRDYTTALTEAIKQSNEIYNKEK